MSAKSSLFVFLSPLVALLIAPSAIVSGQWVPNANGAPGPDPHSKYSLYLSARKNHPSQRENLRIRALEIRTLALGLEQMEATR